jgi:hypothetical protein
LKQKYSLSIRTEKEQDKEKMKSRRNSRWGREGEKGGQE